METNLDNAELLRLAARERDRMRAEMIEREAERASRDFLARRLAEKRRATADYPR